MSAVDSPAGSAGYKLAEHIEAMADDAYLVGHPEWEEIVREARAILQAAQREQNSDRQRAAVLAIADEIRREGCALCNGPVAWWQPICDACNEKTDPDGAAEDRKGL